MGAGRIEGAIHLPLAELSGRAGELDKGRPVVVYCRGGNRCRMAAEALASAGFDAAPMAGGIRAWAEAGLPLTKPRAATWRRSRAKRRRSSKRCQSRGSR